RVGSADVEFQDARHDDHLPPGSERSYCGSAMGDSSNAPRRGLEDRMPDVIEYPFDSGGSVLVTVENAGGESVVTRGWGEDRSRRVAEQANETFESAVAKVRPAADALLASLSGLRSTPSEITVEFAVQLTAEAGICIATLGSSANFKIA